jgi:hypothetical protein
LSEGLAVLKKSGRWERVQDRPSAKRDETIDANVYDEQLEARAKRICLPDAP